MGHIKKYDQNLSIGLMYQTVVWIDEEWGHPPFVFFFFFQIIIMLNSSNIYM